MRHTYLANLKHCCKSQYYYCEGNNYNDYNYVTLYVQIQFTVFGIARYKIFLLLFDVRSGVMKVHGHRDVSREVHYIE